MKIAAGETPLVLLCPAWKNWGAATSLESNAMILHSRDDDVIPFADSQELVSSNSLPSGILIEIGSDHRLADPASLQIASLQMMLSACQRPTTECSQMSDSAASDRHLALKVVMMPKDTNPHGTIFGGVILSYIDQAGAVGAYHELRESGYGRKSIVTVAMKSVEFHRPVFVGDVLSFWTELVRLGRTSITMHVMIEAERDGELQKLTEAQVTYVAIESKGHARRPVPISEPSA